MNFKICTFTMCKLPLGTKITENSKGEVCVDVSSENEKSPRRSLVVQLK